MTLNQALPSVQAEDTAVSVLERLGYSAFFAKGAGRGNPHLVTVEHDGVPYSLDLQSGHRKLDPDKAERGLNRRRLIIERHHELVKAVYEHCSTRLGSDVWAMCGGGAQLQVFFGNKTGYLAILYLDLEDLQEHERLSKSGYLAAVGNAAHTLYVEWAHNNATFAGLSHPRIVVRQSSHVSPRAPRT